MDDVCLLNYDLAPFTHLMAMHCMRFLVGKGLFFVDTP